MNTNEVLKLALEAITTYLSESPDPSEEAVEGLCDAASMLKKALAEQPAQQEPVAWMVWGDNNVPSLTFTKPSDKYVFDALYTSPPQRTWVGLTDVEWMNIVNKDQAWFGQRPDEVAHEVAKLVEAKLKEKNT